MVASSPLSFARGSVPTDFLILLLAADQPMSWHDLPSVSSSKQSDEPQLWHTIDTTKATAATLTCTWHDQGYGNRKGMVFARKAGGQWVALSTSIAPHDPARLSVAIPTKELGGKLEFAYRVGGGGGHSLSIESAAVKVDGEGRGGALSVGEIIP